MLVETQDALCRSCGERLEKGEEDYCAECYADRAAMHSIIDEDDDLIDGVGFADPGGNSALRAATRENPRSSPCPECGEPNRLTRIDVLRGYCCDACADAKERGY
jgi:NMD protein affecting ribosome stability and mRNA decay